MMTKKLLTIAELYKVRAKLKQLRDLCSGETFAFGYMDDRYEGEPDFEVCRGRAELAQSILELIGEEMSKELGTIDLPEGDDDE